MPLTDEEQIIAGRLKHFRETLRIKQKDVAAGSGSSQSHVSAMESGEKQIQPRVIIFLAEEYYLNVDWLFTGRGEMQLGNLVQESGAPYKMSTEKLEARVSALEEKMKKIVLK